MGQQKNKDIEDMQKHYSQESNRGFINKMSAKEFEQFVFDSLAHLYEIKMHDVPFDKKINDYKFKSIPELYAIAETHVMALNQSCESPGEIITIIALMGFIYDFSALRNHLQKFVDLQNTQRGMF